MSPTTGRIYASQILHRVPWTAYVLPESLYLASLYLKYFNFPKISTLVRPTSQSNPYTPLFRPNERRMANELFSTFEKEKMDSKTERGEIVGIFKWKTRLSLNFVQTEWILLMIFEIINKSIRKWERVTCRRIESLVCLLNDLKGNV